MLLNTPARLGLSSKISEATMPGSTVEEMRQIVGEAVNARRDRGQSEAVFQAARELGLTPRRVLAILRAEVARVWADELDTARAWHADFCARQADKLAYEAERYRMRAAALKERTR